MPLNVGLNYVKEKSSGCLPSLLRHGGKYKDIEDITRWREDMNFMFSWQTQYLTRSLRSPVRYCVCHENIIFISSSQRVMFFLLYGDKISEIAHFYSLLVASVEKFFENLPIVQGLLFCVFVVEAFGKLFHLFIV